MVQQDNEAIIQAHGEIFTVEAGKIVACNTYCDAATLMRQLGLLPV